MKRAIQLNLVRFLAAAAAVAMGLAVFAGVATAQLPDPMQNIGVRPELLKEVGIDQKLNDSIPLDLTFNDEHGQTVELRQYFGQQPVILSLVYYNCPMLCTQVLNGLDRSLKQFIRSISARISTSSRSASIRPKSRCWPRQSSDFTRECTAGPAPATAGIS